MRKVIFGGANSLDNYIARADDSVDWLMWCKEAGEVMREYWARIDTILMGRRTYEVAMASSGGKLPHHTGMKSYVFSRTLKEISAKGVELVSSDVADFVRELKNQEGKDILVMGGGLLAKPLFDADLIDEVGLNIHPVLLGSGIPLFHAMSHQINLELTECRPFKNGCVLVTYGVKRPVQKKGARKGGARR